jgi:hypothetical protein
MVRRQDNRRGNSLPWLPRLSQVPLQPELPQQQAFRQQAAIAEAAVAPEPLYSVEFSIKKN